MGISNDTDDALNKAAENEAKMVEFPDGPEKDKARRMANLLFKRAMKNDGHPDYAEYVI